MSSLQNVERSHYIGVILIVALHTRELYPRLAIFLRYVSAAPDTFGSCCASVRQQDSRHSR